VVYGDIGEQATKDRLERSGQRLDESSQLGEPHDAEPQGHDTNKPDGQRYGVLGAVDGTVDDSLKLTARTTYEHSEQHEAQPDVIEHDGFCLAAGEV
jgi:hypothetical protein